MDTGHTRRFVLAGGPHDGAQVEWKGPVDSIPNPFSVPSVHKGLESPFLDPGEGLPTHAPRCHDYVRGADGVEFRGWGVLVSKEVSTRPLVMARLIEGAFLKALGSAPRIKVLRIPDTFRLLGRKAVLVVQKVVVNSARYSAEPWRQIVFAADLGDQWGGTKTMLVTPLVVHVLPVRRKIVTPPLIRTGDLFWWLTGASDQAYWSPNFSIRSKSEGDLLQAAFRNARSNIVVGAEEIGERVEMVVPGKSLLPASGNRKTGR